MGRPRAARELVACAQRGIWLEGGHVVSDVFGQPRLAGSALLWRPDGVAYRLEGRLTKAQALQIARTVGFP